MAKTDDYSIHWQSQSKYAKFWRSVDQPNIASFLLDVSPQATLAAQEKACDFVKKSGDKFRSLIALKAGRVVIKDGAAFSARLIGAANDWRKKFGARFAALMLQHVAAAKFGISLETTVLNHLEVKLGNGDLDYCTNTFIALVLDKTTIPIEFK